MGYLYADALALENDVTMARAAITGVQTVEGNKVIWNITTVAAAYDVTVAEYDATRAAQYKYLDRQPTITIRCAADCSVFNVSILSSDGAGGSTTHYTFAADYSATPRYVTLKLSATEGADGTRLWELG
jgi:hypothetical protein